METISSDGLREALAALPGWTGDTKAISADYAFATYEAGVAFAVQVALIAQRIDHHPDITIGWQRVRVMYTSHDAGGVTPRDLVAARAVAAIAPAAGT